jgi:hydrogenase maturation protein HypF
MIRSSEIVNRRLAHVVDGILDHDRTIINALDDAVIQIAEDRVVMLRMGRGFAPHTFALQDLPTNRF